MFSIIFLQSERLLIIKDKYERRNGFSWRLQYIIAAGWVAGIREIRFGRRQQILMGIKAETFGGNRIVELKKKLYKSKIS
jgi:hypothetical protein